jgi:hypothetical protein
VTELELERALTDLAGHLEHPPTPPLAEAVLVRLAAEPATAPPGGRWRWLLAGPAWRRVAVAALALIVLAAGIVVATPGAREAVARRLGIPGIAVHLGGPAPTTSAQPTARAAGANLGLGRRVTLEQARGAVSFRMLVPRAAGFEQPDAVYLSQDVPGGRVDFVYRPRPGLPVSRFTNAGLLITQFHADPVVEKFAKGVPGVEPVTVDGEAGYWFGTAPHSFVYTDQAGNFREETTRLAGSTLIWTHGGVTLRLEGQVTKAEAVRIATSMR